MARDYDVITFDCYGTLIDWERGILDAFRSAMAADGVAVDPARTLAVYHEVEPAVQSEGYRRYRDVLAATARRVAVRLDWPMPASRAGALADSLPEWPAFPDTRTALARLSTAGYRLGILSNIDDDLLAGSRRHLGVPFEIAITAQQVAAYKPARPHFDAARASVGDARWLHAAQSYFHDVQPARALGIRTAWINRKAEPPTDGGHPDPEFRDLTGLADWLAP